MENVTPSHCAESEEVGDRGPHAQCHRHYDDDSDPGMLMTGFKKFDVSAAFGFTRTLILLILQNTRCLWLQAMNLSQNSPMD